MTNTEKLFRSAFKEQAIESLRRPDFRVFDMNNIYNSESHTNVIHNLFKSDGVNGEVVNINDSTLELYVNTLNDFTGTPIIVFGRTENDFNYSSFGLLPSFTNLNIYTPYTHVEYNKKEDVIKIVSYMAVFLYREAYSKHADENGSILKDFAVEPTFCRFDIDLYSESFIDLNDPKSNDSLVYYYKVNDFSNYEDSFENFSFAATGDPNTVKDNKTYMCLERYLNYINDRYAGFAMLQTKYVLNHKIKD